MSQIKLKHSGGNSVIIAAPDSNPASDVTLKLPQADGSDGQFMKTDGSGNLVFATVDNRPAFRAALSANADFSATPTSTVPFDTEAFDLGGCFNNTSSAATLNGISVPAHSFLPNVAGTYFVSCIARVNSSVAGTLTQFNTDLVKNSTVIGRFDNDPKNDNPDHIVSGSITTIIDMNGTSDYLFVRTTASASSGTLRHLAADGGNIFSAFKLII